MKNHAMMNIRKSCEAACTATPRKSTEHPIQMVGFRPYLSATNGANGEQPEIQWRRCCRTVPSEIPRDGGSNSAMNPGIADSVTPVSNEVELINDGYEHST